ncbi:uncharacterized protein EV154DRAFT_516116 [Mucor mucedo]|uniref:Pre-mRNA-splicing factor CWC2 n=1 Tax=Mucor saturninus TaxID=64648 RepID=A0A8H7UUW7_9FUNG|nr:uncharacterized protein EV154DRAFT_516116 [Mucor mucedo]KAG2196550.1 hypothetical protein INT47_010389 [Mucor saturninus]KAI7888962.1 hypothetical protein EV154DRAFT_516116 [Mucor mucedo]
MNLTRPARVQVTQAELDDYLKDKRPEGGTYNIWHHRYSGLERDFNKQSVRPKFKVDIARDAGLTIGSRNKNAYFCLFFAKGMCSQGPKCAMWHRVPTTEDKLETTIDCFGRDKFTEFRQDMGGVGGFIRENRTLYVGRIAISSDTENVIRRQFGQFGPLERVRILKNRGVAFVTYKTRANAEFAREAMMNQNLENNEIINVRWATADPNAIANRLDAEDDQLEEQRVAQILAENAGTNEDQDVESELPAEFTSVKRDMDESGFNQTERHLKKQKPEEVKAITEAQDAYTQEDYDNYYRQQQQYIEYQEQQQKENEKVGGIIPKNILANLKTLAKNTTTTPVKTPEKKTTSGLGNLADYGSDSEED